MAQSAIAAVRVLVVEDDPDTQELISTLLSDAGYSSMSAADGVEGLEKARKEVPDLILLDIMMPRMDGIEMCRRLTADERTRGIPVIMITAKDDLATKLSSFVAGARRFLVKPFDTQELINEVQRTLRSRNLSGEPDVALDPMS